MQGDALSSAAPQSPARDTTHVEYAVRYDAPTDYTGIVAHVTRERWLAERCKRGESHPAGGIRCTVVQRTVTYGDWVDATEGEW